RLRVARGPAALRSRFALGISLADRALRFSRQVLVCGLERLERRVPARLAARVRGRYLFRSHAQLARKVRRCSNVSAGLYADLQSFKAICRTHWPESGPIRISRSA